MRTKISHGWNTGKTRIRLTSRPSSSVFYPCSIRGLDSYPDSSLISLVAIETARSGQHFFDRLLWLDAGQSLIEPLELVTESLVIDPQAVQYRGVEIVDVTRVLRD